MFPKSQNWKINKLEGDHGTRVDSSHDGGRAACGDGAGGGPSGSSASGPSSSSSSPLMLGATSSVHDRAWRQAAIECLRERSLKEDGSFDRDVVFSMGNLAVGCQPMQKRELRDTLVPRAGEYTFDWKPDHPEDCSTILDVDQKASALGRRFLQNVSLFSVVATHPSRLKVARQSTSGLEGDTVVVAPLHILEVGMHDQHCEVALEDVDGRGESDLQVLTTTMLSDSIFFWKAGDELHR